MTNILIVGRRAQASLNAVHNTTQKLHLLVNRR